MDTGFHWGEWLVPDEDVGDFGAFIAADKGDVATAYFARRAQLMSLIAAVLGRRADVARYAELAADVRAAWQAEYLVDLGEAGGRLTPDTQATCGRSSVARAMRARRPG